MESKPTEQHNNSNHEVLEAEKMKFEWLRPWQFKPGQSGNPSGRPKGSVSLKEYAKRMLGEMNEEEKLEFMKGLPKETIWKMAEGNPQTSTDVKIDNKSPEDMSNEELELAKQILEQRRSKTNGTPSQGTDTLTLGGEVSDQK